MKKSTLSTAVNTFNVNAPPTKTRTDGARNGTTFASRLLSLFPIDSSKVPEAQDLPR
jgi:hypothetical protein